MKILFRKYEMTLWPPFEPAVEAVPASRVRDRSGFCEPNSSRQPDHSGFCEPNSSHQLTRTSIDPSPECGTPGMPR
jgi:hypothetical protein